MQNDYTPDQQAAFLAQFDRSASVTHEGQSYQLPESLLLEMITSRHGIDSSWFIADIVGRVKFLYGSVLPRSLALQLTADTIKTTLQAVEDALDWNASYMAWHDAMDVEEVHVWLS